MKPGSDLVVAGLRPIATRWMVAAVGDSRETNTVPGLGLR
jgi:hypothetical protein